MTQNLINFQIVPLNRGAYHKIGCEICKSLPLPVMLERKDDGVVNGGNHEVMSTPYSGTVRYFERELDYIQWFYGSYGDETSIELINGCEKLQVKQREFRDSIERLIHSKEEVHEPSSEVNASPNMGGSLTITNKIKHHSIVEKESCSSLINQLNEINDMFRELFIVNLEKIPIMARDDYKLKTKPEVLVGRLQQSGHILREYYAANKGKALYFDWLQIRTRESFLEFIAEYERNQIAELIRSHGHGRLEEFGPLLDTLFARILKMYQQPPLEEGTKKQLLDAKKVFIARYFSCVIFFNWSQSINELICSTNF